MGPSLLQYLPSTVFAMITLVSLVIAVRLRGAASAHGSAC